MTTDDTVPLLKTASASTNNEFAFWLLGDMGRRYRILSTSGLTSQWWAESSFPGPGPGLTGPPPGSSSVVIGWTGTDRFALPKSAPLKLFRASTYHATNEICNNHLKQLRFAALLCYYDNHLPFSASIGFADIIPYFKGGNLPFCPEGGTYDFGFATLPFCNLPWHVLEEPYR